METQIPNTYSALYSLLRADFTTLLRNRRSVILALILPTIIIIGWKGLITKLGGAFVLSSSLTMGLIAIGLMGYSNSIARDRDKGVFQRLRVTPVPTWSIMTSRLIVQFSVILLLTIIVFIVGNNYGHIQLSPAGYALTFVTSFVGGAVYLGLGQMIVGLVKNAETVNSTTRLVYFVFIIVGMFGDLSALSSDAFTKELFNISKWSPYGTVKTIVAAGMQPSGWNGHASLALLVTILYAVAFSLLGIKKFKWNSQ